MVGNSSYNFPFPIKIALVGNTGVGKTTFVNLLKKYFKKREIKEIKLAAPLYRAQSFIYKICNKEKDAATQDGILLNFLGQHMRFINPDVIKNYFLSQLTNISSHLKVIVCSDARPLDIAFLKQQNFLLIHIVCDEITSRKRRIERGDLSLGNSLHWTEKPSFSFEPDYEIENNESLENYELKIINLLRQFSDICELKQEKKRLYAT